MQYSDNNSAWTAAATFSLDWTAAGLGRCLAFPVVAPSAGKYLNWRMQINSNAAMTTPSGVECEMRETAGGADITSTTPQYAIWSDHFQSGFEGFLVFDNNTGTMWAAGTPTPGNFVGQAFNKSVQIVEIRWTARNDSLYTQSPLTATMQGTNDGVTWVNAGTVTFSAWTGAGQSQTVSVV